MLPIRSRILTPCCALALLLAASSAHAQNQAPDAPLPSAPTTPAKPTFVLPSTPYTLPAKDTPPPPSAKEREDETDVCGAPPDGVYSRANQHVPDAMRGVLQAYFNDVGNRIHGQWAHTMSIGQRNAWARSKVVTVRFAIRPDGSYFPPEITVSSTHSHDDAHALDAIKSFDAFPPLPAGVSHPVVFCMKFGYNTEFDPSLPSSMSGEPKPAKKQ